MLIGVLSWLDKNQRNYSLKFEEHKCEEKIESKTEKTQDTFKFPAWFTDSKHRLKQYDQNEQKIAAKFDELFGKVMQTNTFHALSQVLSKEDLELIKAPGKNRFT